MVALNDLAPASFRGVRFLVPRDHVEEGPNLILHRYPDSSVTYAEYNGRQSPEFHVTAVLHGPGLMGQFNSLRSALNVDLPGTLHHPWFGARYCAVKGPWKVKREDTDSGVLELEICFVETGPPLLPAVVNAIAAVVSGLSASLIGAAFSAFTAQFGQPSMSTVSLETVSGAITDIASTFSFELGAAEGVSTAARHLIDQPEYYISDSTALGYELASVFRSPFDDAEVSYTGAQIATALTKVDAAVDIIEARGLVIAPVTLDYIVRQESLLTFSTFCRVACCSALAEAMVGTTYTTAEQVAAAKDQLLALYAKIGPDRVPSDIGQQIAKVVATALDVLHQEELQLPRISTIPVRPDKPASVLAYQLYDTDDRTWTIIDLNVAANPLLIEREANILDEA